MQKLKAHVLDLYTGNSPKAHRLRYGLILFDLFVVGYFVATTPLITTPLLQAINALLLVLIVIDFLCRLWIAPNKWEHMGRIYVLADVVVIASLILNPLLNIDLTFLLILRGVRLGRSTYLLEDLRRDSRFFRYHEDAIVSVLNLVVFVFVASCAVYVLFIEESQRGWAGFIDSVYFTVTTLTTTGYGDLTPTDIPGKLTSVAIMVIGVSLFLRLASTVFMPNKVHHVCDHCGLTRHDADAVHCKHCGELVRIETKGAG